MTPTIRHSHGGDYPANDHHPHGGDRPRDPSSASADRIRHGVSEFFGSHSHDAADQIDDALEANAAGWRALGISLIGLGVTAVLQAVVVALSGSVALLGDTLHNVADALTAVPLLVAFRLALRPANKRYTYGYGRAEDLAGLFVITMIALSSVLAAYEAIHRLLRPQQVNHLWAVAGAAVMASSATNWSPATASVSDARSARPPSSPTGCTPAPTASPASPSSSEQAASHSACPGPIQWLASSSPSPSSAYSAQP
jgi:uncharacterized membrane protein